METNETLFAYYRQFSTIKSEYPGSISENKFLPVDAEEIRKFRLLTKKALPEIYEEFLMEVGSGNYNLGADGILATEDPSFFMEPEFIADTMGRKTDDWFLYPDLIADDDIPFFYLGEGNMHVFRCLDGRNDVVCSPFGDVIIAENFLTFLELLKYDPVFHRKLSGW